MVDQNTESGGPFYRGEESESTLDISAILLLLSDTLRREILWFLIQSPDESVPVETLFDHLRHETHHARDELEIRCHHVHLPKLQQAGVIDYDARMGDVRYRQVAMLERLLNEIAALSQ